MVEILILNEKTILNFILCIHVVFIFKKLSKEAGKNEKIDKEITYLVIVMKHIEKEVKSRRIS